MLGSISGLKFLTVRNERGKAEVRCWHQKDCNAESSKDAVLPKDDIVAGEGANTEIIVINYI